MKNGLLQLGFLLRDLNHSAVFFVSVEIKEERGR